MEYYGWLGSNNKRNVFERNSGTDTATYIKYYAKKAGATKIDGVRSKNLLNYKNENYYILSIRDIKTGWAPYPQILELKPNLVLTADCNNLGQCAWWLIKGDSYNYKVLKLYRRENAGDYYSLSVNQIKDENSDFIIKGKTKVKNGEEDSISNVWNLVTNNE